MKQWLRFALVLLLLFPFTLLANDNDVMEWGEVPAEHWEILSFPEDDDAHSIILGDYGKTYIDRRMELVHERHIRVKILDVDRSGFTDISIPLYVGNRMQSINRVRAQTINQNPDGSERIERIRRRDIHSETSGDIETTSFAFPDLEPGSIVEYRYRIESRSITFLRPWEFQHSSPILKSDYQVLVPKEVSYLVFNRGYEAFDKNVMERESDNVLIPADMMPSESYTYYHWILRNAPAIRSEPYITTVSDYKNRVDFQLSGYYDRNGFYNNFLTSWDDVAEELSTSRDFGRQVSTNRRMRSEISELVDGLETDFEKAKRLYDFVASEVSWNGDFTIYADEGVSDTWSDLVGSASDKALLLITLLDEVGIEAHPVLISTRGNGKVEWRYPRVIQFNHVLVYASVDGADYILEPLMSEIPFGMVMPNSLNEGGLMINGKTAEILQIDALTGSVRDVRAIVQIDAEGKLKGTIQSKYSGYEGILNRLMVEESNEEEYFIEETLSDLPNTRIVDQSLLNIDDPDEIFETRLDIENDDYTLAAGDMIYLNPFFTNRISENPFTNPVRNFPIEYAYGVQNAYMTSIQIPPEYEVIEVPEAAVLRLSESTTFVMQAVSNPQNVQIVTRFVRADTNFPAQMYDDIREFYSDIAGVYNQQIVLQKRAPAESSAGNSDISDTGEDN